MIRIISVKHQGRIRNRGDPQAASYESESYLASADWIMVCEQTKFHPHEIDMLSDEHKIHTVLLYKSELRWLSLNTHRVALRDTP